MRLWVPADESLPCSKDVRRTAKAGAEGVLPAERVLSHEALDSSRRRETKRVDTLVVIAGDKHQCALAHHTVHELQVHRVQVLEFVDDKMRKVQQFHGIQRSGRHLHHTLPHNLARQNACVTLRSWSMERRELTAFSSGNGGAWWHVVRRAPLACTPECLVL